MSNRRKDDEISLIVCIIVALTTIVVAIISARGVRRRMYTKPVTGRGTGYVNNCLNNTKEY